MQWDRGIDHVILVAVQSAARLERGAGVKAGRKHSGREVRGWIKRVVAEGVASDAEGARVDVEDLVRDALAEGPLIVQLQSAVIRPARLHRQVAAAPYRLVVRARRDGR